MLFHTSNIQFERKGRHFNPDSGEWPARSLQEGPTLFPAENLFEDGVYLSFQLVDYSGTN